MASVTALAPSDLPAPSPAGRKPLDANGKHAGVENGAGLVVVGAGEGTAPGSAAGGGAAAEPSVAPLWFRKEAFTEATFAADAYVNDLRRYGYQESSGAEVLNATRVPLETLRTELDNHLKSLNHELVELINKDYADFVNLSTKLVDVEGAVLRMRSPLVELQTKLRGVRGDTAEALARIETGLARRQEAATTRGVLELMLDTANVVAKVEKLLAELKTAEAAATGPEALARLLERIGSESGVAAGGQVNRLKFYVTHGAGLPLVEGMLPRIKNAERELTDALRTCLRAALTRQDLTVSLQCLLAYAAMDDTKGAEEDVRAVLVAPVVRALVEGAPAGAAPPALYKAVYDGVAAQCGFLLELTSPKHAGMHVFDFLGASLLVEIDAVLAELHPGMFSAGVPATFLANYNAALKFLGQLEGHCPTQAALAALRASPAAASFLKRWNLSVYFTLRFQEIAGDLDTGLAGNPLARAADSGGAFKLTLTAVVWQCLQKCWASEIFAPALADRFLRLALQLVARFAGHLQAGMAARTAAAAAAAGAAAGAEAGKAPSAAAQSPAKPGAAASPGGGAEWMVAATAEELALVRHDVEALAALVEGEYTATVELTLAHLPAAAAAGVAGALGEGGRALAAALPALDAAVTAAVVEKCVEALKQMRGITATYRMTNKPLPTRHSHFVPSVLGPLKAFVNGEQAEVLGAAATEALVAAVSLAVTERYEAMAEELVTTVRKTESSLKRLKGRKGAGADPKAEGAGAASDTDKICHQLMLDVKEFGRNLQYLGVTPASLPAYERLSKIVSPEGSE